LMSMAMANWLAEVQQAFFLQSLCQ